jgi:transposase-like protein
MNTKKKQPSYSGEFRDRAVRLVEEQQKVGLSQWAMRFFAVSLAQLSGRGPIWARAYNRWL